ncbi:MAG: divalent metal cation transporter, partial [bacterium]|nr:divalent metal cation transporter [bacterium]
LIITTTLGAQAGFVCLWVILVACLLKVTVQLEFGKHAINTGETALESFNKLPGPRARGVSWSVWAWFAVRVAQFIQYGGIVGGVALAMHLAFPAIEVWVWTWITGIATALMIFRGRYPFIEKVAVTLTALFSLFTVVCVVLLQRTSYRITWADIGEGLSFQLPAVAIGVAIAAFSATGVSADEIMAYPYWCIEKGYARWTGPRDASEQWARRARGWIRVMYWDALLSMVIYTLATAAFYILGAAILHGRGAIPEGYDMIQTLSQIYTESFGPEAMVIFLMSAVVVLFSTLFVNCAATARMVSDGLAQFGCLDFHNDRQRERWIAVMAWLFPLSWTVLFLTVKAPVLMIVAGGAGVAVLLLVVVLAAHQYRYRRLDARLRPGRFYDAMLWLAFAAVIGVGVRVVAELFGV